MHFMALHVHGSSNPLGITGNIDRLSMHPYFIFKDAITVFVFLLVYSLFVFYSPNTMGLIKWPVINLILLIQCAICWKYLFIYNKTFYVSDLFFFKSYANPLKVKYYYKKYNQQITKVKYLIFYKLLFLVDIPLVRGVYSSKIDISETIRTQKILFKNNDFSKFIHNNSNLNKEIKFNE